MSQSGPIAAQNGMIASKLGRAVAAKPHEAGRPGFQALFEALLGGRPGMAADQARRGAGNGPASEGKVAEDITVPDPIAGLVSPEPAPAPDAAAQAMAALLAAQLAATSRNGPQAAPGDSQGREAGGTVAAPPAAAGDDSGLQPDGVPEIVVTHRATHLAPMGESRLTPAFQGESPLGLQRNAAEPFPPEVPVQAQAVVRSSAHDVKRAAESWAPILQPATAPAAVRPGRTGADPQVDNGVARADHEETRALLLSADEASIDTNPGAVARREPILAPPQAGSLDRPAGGNNAIGQGGPPEPGRADMVSLSERRISAPAPAGARPDSADARAAETKPNSADSDLSTPRASGPARTMDSPEALPQSPASVSPPLQAIADLIRAEAPAPGAVAGPGSSGWAAVLRRDAVKVLHLQLQPAELGTVNIRMRLVGNALEVHIEPSLQGTADLLRHDEQTLKSLLETSGFTPDVVTIASPDRAAFEPAGPLGQGAAGPNSEHRPDRQSNPFGSERDRAGGQQQGERSAPQQHDRMTKDNEPASASSRGGDLYL